MQAPTITGMGKNFCLNAFFDGLFDTSVRLRG